MFRASLLAIRHSHEHVVVNSARGTRTLASAPTRASHLADTHARALTSDEIYHWPIGTAGLAALALVGGLVSAKGYAEQEETSSLTKCEVVSHDPASTCANEPALSKPVFRQILSSELRRLHDDSDLAKSKRACAHAFESELFGTYEDGADDWEEVDDDNNTQSYSQAENASKGLGSNTVLDRFVSFSSSSGPLNLKPRTSIRHTNRTIIQQEQRDKLLATSDGLKVDAPVNVDGSNDKDVALDRVNVVRHQGLGNNQVYTRKMYFYQSVQIKEHMRNKFRLFALPSSEHLGKEMALLLGTGLHCVNIGAFSDGETSVKIEDTVRGKEVYVVCTTTSTTAIMELLLTISALRRGSAKRICAVIPYYGYSRQDRRTGMKREPIGAADVAKLIEEMGVDSVICCDLHNPLLKGFFSPTVPVDHIMPGPVAAAYFYEELFDVSDGHTNEKKKQQVTPKITVVAAHENQVFRANGFRNALQKLSGNDDIRVALISNTKAFNVHENSDSTLVGDVKGRKCIIIDDIINTGGTMRNAITMVHNAGASEIYSWATHGVLHLQTNDAPQKIQDLDCLKYLLISNSVAIDRELPPKIRKLSIAPLLAEAVARSYHSESISAMLNVKAPGSEK
ncbi:hypothetical protein ACHAXH_001579 [Discostella pseudostelligera]